jgi:hypothetical protein
MLIALEGPRQYLFQEQAQPDGSSKTEMDECAGHQGSHPGSVYQPRIYPDEVSLQHALEAHVCSRQLLMDMHDMWQEGDR